MKKFKICTFDFNTDETFNKIDELERKIKESLKNDLIIERLKTKSLFVELIDKSKFASRVIYEHELFQIDLTKVGLLITKLYERNKKIYAICETLDTKIGKELEKALDGKNINDVIDVGTKPIIIEGNILYFTYFKYK